MNKSRRLIPDWPLPAYIFVPGNNPHPKKEGGHMEGLPEPVATPIDLQGPGKSEFLRFAVDLYNQGYFWESHVYFEALWNAHGRQGSVADFFKGFIKLGAAGVKLNIDQEVAARGHFERAKELFEGVMKDEGDSFLGFDLKKINASIDLMLENGKLQCFEIYPDWD